MDVDNNVVAGVERLQKTTKTHTAQAVLQNIHFFHPHQKIIDNREKVCGSCNHRAKNAKRLLSNFRQTTEGKGKGKYPMWDESQDSLVLLRVKISAGCVSISGLVCSHFHGDEL